MKLFESALKNRGFGKNLIKLPVDNISVTVTWVHIARLLVEFLGEAGMDRLCSVQLLG